MTVFTIGGVAFLAAQLGFWARGRRHLALLAGGLCSATLLAASILEHNTLGICINTGGVATVLLWFSRGGPRRRKRARKELGDESRQLRDGLVRRMRQGRVTRPGWSPSPSPSR